ncbi:MAG TPA: DUF6600 domain-containing protein, partial [Kofleriaceae bacterium]|nr:DUF6600 domain-containing protein [Kofleriaceae bacterium]
MRLRILSTFLLAACVPANNPPASVGVYGQVSTAPTAPPPPAPAPPPTPPPTPEVVVQSPPTPPPPPAEPVDEEASDPVYEDVSSVNVEGNDVPNVDVFYNELAQYGTWYDDPAFGWVFAPENNGHVPYSNGNWKYTDYGYTWVS